MITGSYQYAHGGAQTVAYMRTLLSPISNNDYKHTRLTAKRGRKDAYTAGRIMRNRK